MSDDIAIKVENLTKIYKLYNTPMDRLKESLSPLRRKYHHDFHALRDVSFEVKKGGTVGIIGNNGSGKSTLLKIIAGILTPTSGNVVVNGRIAALLELGGGFNPELTGRENVFLNGAFLGIDRNEMEERYHAIEKFADIGEFIEQPVKMYSSGMFVRLAFSVSICVEPDILIVDEALSVGDAAFQLKCLDRLTRITKAGTTLLFVSHDMGAIKSFCDRAIYLKSGHLRALGSPDLMGELYLIDTRDDQVKALTGTMSVKQKEFIGNNNGIAFGTDQGRITRAYFANSGAMNSTFITGDSINVIIETQFDDSVHNPAITIMLLDNKMLLLGACSYPIKPENKDLSRRYSANVTCSFKAILGQGDYSITVKLDDRKSNKQFYPIDKQVGLLFFKILQPNDSTFLGAVDLAMEFSE